MRGYRAAGSPPAGHYRQDDLDDLDRLARRLVERGAFATYGEARDAVVVQNPPELVAQRRRMDAGRWTVEGDWHG